MTKIISVVILCAMAAHLIRPFGVPGLRKRSDAWKLALLALVLFAVLTLVRPE
ncbi:MAG: hypothetical protein AAF615_05440 [Pseudomonadota bacterium]